MLQATFDGNLLRTESYNKNKHLAYFIWSGLGVVLKFLKISEILKVFLKFTPCPEFFPDVLKFLSTPANGASALL